ncbi:ABC transporter ATP-binding protein [Metabacillus bambusae]|uniref:ABC transporter ATP-binding protein n=1 Tax=Metabacillus bambusae TaxID=2795218 RepID=A0ABS3MXB7_9BACI|nr:ABC transporter ATP-binding protein [Metabacillus bambusae]MBO1510663.1 ABC transporter ATP-binding protein [Metabacillus bambusae]
MKTRPIFHQHLFKHKWSYLLGSGLLTISLVLQLGVPLLLEDFTDGIQHLSIQVSDLWNLAVWFSVLGVGIFLFRSSGRIYIFRLSRMLERDLRTQLFSHWETLPADYYQQERIGNLMAHAVNDVNILRQIGMQGVFQTVEAMVLISITITMMAGTIDLYLTLLVLIPLPGLTYLAYRFRTKIRMHSSQVQEAIGTLTSRVQEFCTGIRIIKTYVQEQEEMKKFTKENVENVKANKQLIRSNSLFTSLSQGIVGLSYLLSVVFGSILVMKGTITLGEFVAFNTYLSFLVAPIENLGKVINLFQQGKAADIRLSDVLATTPDIKDEEGVIPINKFEGDIRIQNLSFQYKNSKGYALQNINLTIKKGTSIGIVGKIGSGKSTLVNLLLRVYNPPKKSIFIDNYDIHDLPLKTLRTSIGYVPQTNFLFSSTIKENIAFDPSIYQDKDIYKAAKQSHVYKDIIDFPEGFDTPLGERGLSLSGGQRQRVSIARAMIKKSPIMIFDDSLSAVDAKTEELILKTLQTEMKGRTSVIISHRMSTIRKADQIIVLDEGKIVEQGTHESLLKRNGTYKKMYLQQSNEFTLEDSTPLSSSERTVRIKKRRG